MYILIIKKTTNNDDDDFSTWYTCKKDFKFHITTTIL